MLSLFRLIIGLIILVGAYYIWCWWFKLVDQELNQIEEEDLRDGEGE